MFEAERVDHAHAALAVLLSLNGLRVSEACSADIENLSFERGHRVLRIVGEGNKPAVIPLVPRTAGTIDLAIGERTSGPTCSATTAAASTGAPPTAARASTATPPTWWSPLSPAADLRSSHVGGQLQFHAAAR